MTKHNANVTMELTDTIRKLVQEYADKTGVLPTTIKIGWFQSQSNSCGYVCSVPVIHFSNHTFD